MYVEGTATRRASVRIAQTSRGQFTGWIDTESGTEVFGPYEGIDELTAVMADYVAGAVREAKRNILRLVK